MQRKRHAATVVVRTLLFVVSALGASHAWGAAGNADILLHQANRQARTGFEDGAREVDVAVGFDGNIVVAYVIGTETLVVRSSMDGGRTWTLLWEGNVGFTHIAELALSITGGEPTTDDQGRPAQTPQHVYLAAHVVQAHWEFDKNQGTDIAVSDYEWLALYHGDAKTPWRTGPQVVFANTSGVPAVPFATWHPSVTIFRASSFAILLPSIKGNDHAVGAAFMHPDSSGNSIYAVYSFDKGKGLTDPRLVAGPQSNRISGLDFRHPSMAYDEKHEQIFVAFDDDVTGDVKVARGELVDHVLQGREMDLFLASQPTGHAFHHSPEIAIADGKSYVTYLARSRSTSRDALVCLSGWNHNALSFDWTAIHGDVLSAADLDIVEGQVVVTVYGDVDNGRAYGVLSMVGPADPYLLGAGTPFSKTALNDLPVSAAIPRLAIDRRGGRSAYLWSTAESGPRAPGMGDLYLELR
jgi:hypothetical protein